MEMKWFDDQTSVVARGYKHGTAAVRWGWQNARSLHVKCSLAFHGTQCGVYIWIQIWTQVDVWDSSVTCILYWLYAADGKGVKIKCKLGYTHSPRRKNVHLATVSSLVFRHPPPPPLPPNLVPLKVLYIFKVSNRTKNCHTCTYLKSCLVRAMNGNFCEIEWDVPTSWQLRGLCGNYRVNLELMGTAWKISDI